MREKIPNGKMRYIIHQILKENKGDIDKDIIKEMENRLFKSFVIAQDEAIFLEKIKMPGRIYVKLKQLIFEKLNN